MSLSAASSSIIRLCSICGTRYAHGTEHQCAGQQKRASEGGDLIGAILGERYRIVSALSKGGMGVVYKAQHIVLDKPVAVKVMLTTQDDAAHQRFLQEAKLASLVHHPNIVDIIDFGVLTSRDTDSPVTDLPQPVSPARPQIWPRSTCRSTPLSTCASPS